MYVCKKKRKCSVYKSLNQHYVANDIYISMLKNLKKLFYKCFFCSIVFLFQFVAATFWGIYLMDRELIFPRALDKIFPSWLNHILVRVLSSPLNNCNIFIAVSLISRRLKKPISNCMLCSKLSFNP